MKKISKNDLFNLFNEHVNGGSFIGIDTMTSVKLSGGKNNELLNRVQKINAGSNVMVFQNKNTNAYENMVTKRLAAEGKDPSSFELGVRTWGERIPNTPFIKHTPKGSLTEKLYLEVIFLRSGTVSYLLDGKPIAKALITGLPESREEGEQGDLQNKVIIRSYALDSICRVSIDKEVYIIEN